MGLFNVRARNRLGSCLGAWWDSHTKTFDHREKNFHKVTQFQFLHNESFCLFL
jgi:hypothetical protein